MTETFSIDFWGGMNARDQADALPSNSHQRVQGGWVQFPGVGVESPNLLNVDFGSQGLKKRLGSASYQDLTSILVSGDTLLGGFEFRSPGGSRAEFAIGAKSIYTNQSGTWAQINDSASAAFTFDSDITKFTVTFGDGHWFLGTDGANNEIQTWKTGADLDAEMKLNNTYEDAYGAGTHTITGVWPTGAYLVAFINSRLCWSTGSVLVEYTPMAHTASSGVWDLGGSTAGLFHALGDIRFLTNFIPKGGNVRTDEILVVGTSFGIGATTGFQTYDRINEEADDAPLNHQCFAKADNWIVYATDRKNVKAFNGVEVIDLGVRLKSAAKSGPLDSMSISDSEDDCFALYDGNKAQVKIWFTTSSARVNDSCVVVDFKEGEPVPGEPKNSYEKRIRLLAWQIISPDSNDWFVGGYVKSGATIGVMSSGVMYTMESGRNDLGNLAVNGTWLSPIINGGAPIVTNQKQWGRLTLRSIPAGDWDVTVSEFHDREASASNSWGMNQAPANAALVGVAQVDVSKVSSGGVIRDFGKIDKKSENFQFKLANALNDEDFEIASANVTYETGDQVN